MVSYRQLFIFATLFLAMLMTISSAPVPEDKLESHETTEKPFDKLDTSSDRSEKLHSDKDDDAKKLLFKDTVDESMSIKADENHVLLFGNVDLVMTTARDESREPISILDAKKKQ